MNIKRDKLLFNGYVEQPLSFLLTGVILTLLCIVGACYITSNSVRKMSPSPTVTETHIVDYEMQEGTGYIYIFTSTGYTFDVPADAFSDIAVLSKLIHSGTVQVEYDQASYSEHSDSFLIVSIKSLDGSDIVSADTVAAIVKADAKRDMLVIWGLTALVAGMFAFMFYIMSNAPRYPRLAKTIVRKEFRNF